MRAVAALALALAATVIAAAPAHAGCYERDPSQPQGWNLSNPVGLRTFSVDDEFSRAAIVASVKVVAARKLFEENDEPGYATATEYQAQPLETFKGPVLPAITLYSPTNWRSASRFNMDAGKTYLVFVTTVGNVSTIHNCGWSDELDRAADTLKQVRALAAPAKHG